MCLLYDKINYLKDGCRYSRQEMQKIQFKSWFSKKRKKVEIGKGPNSRGDSVTLMLIFGEDLGDAYPVATLLKSGYTVTVGCPWYSQNFDAEFFWFRQFRHKPIYKTTNYILPQCLSLSLFIVCSKFRSVLWLLFW